MSNCDRSDKGAPGLGMISMVTEGSNGLTFIVSKSP